MEILAVIGVGWAIGAAIFWLLVPSGQRANLKSAYLWLGWLSVLALPVVLVGALYWWWRLGALWESYELSDLMSSLRAWNLLFLLNTGAGILAVIQLRRSAARKKAGEDGSPKLSLKRLVVIVLIFHVIAIVVASVWMYSVSWERSVNTECTLESMSYIVGNALQGNPSLTEQEIHLMVRKGFQSGTFRCLLPLDGDGNPLDQYGQALVVIFEVNGRDIRVRCISKGPDRTLGTDDDISKVFETRAWGRRQNRKGKARRRR